MNKLFLLVLISRMEENNKSRPCFPDANNKVRQYVIFSTFAQVIRYLFFIYVAQLKGYMHQPRPRDIFRYVVLRSRPIAPVIRHTALLHPEVSCRKQPTEQIIHGYQFVPQRDQETVGFCPIYLLYHKFA